MNETPQPPFASQSGQSKDEVLTEIADPQNWRVFKMWILPGFENVTRWIGKPGIMDRARKALEEGKK